MLMNSYLTTGSASFRGAGMSARSCIRGKRDSSKVGDVLSRMLIGTHSHLVGIRAVLNDEVLPVGEMVRAWRIGRAVQRHCEHTSPDNSCRHFTRGTVGDSCAREIAQCEGEWSAQGHFDDSAVKHGVSRRATKDYQRLKISQLRRRNQQVNFISG
jgi:hypothetical protein